MLLSLLFFIVALRHELLTAMEDVTRNSKPGRIAVVHCLGKEAYCNAMKICVLYGFSTGEIMGISGALVSPFAPTSALTPSSYDCSLLHNSEL